MWWLLSALALAQPADESALPTGSIASVVVFPDRAAVSREVTLPLVAGLNEVRFENLPPSLNLQSLQAKGKGIAGSRILGLDVQSRELAEDRRRRVAELEERFQDVWDDIKVQQDRWNAAKAEQDFLSGLKVAAAGQLSAELLFAEETVTDAKNMADLLRTRVPEVQETMRQAAREERDLKATADAIQRELSTVKGAAQWSRRDVVVQVESPTPGDATVELTYILPGASWTASYDARALPDKQRVNLVLNAQITQTTGEDWSDATLTLSTARPAAGVAPPELSPHWLQRHVAAPPAEPVYYEIAGELAEEEDDEDAWMDSEKRDGARAPAAPPPMEVATAVVQQRPVATTFQVPGATTVSGDGTRRKVRVIEEKLEATYIHVAVPRLEESAYLVAQTTWQADWPLLGGDVFTFLDDAFVGGMRVDSVGKGGELELAFGIDDAVQVERETVTDFTSSADWLGKITRKFMWTFEVKNGRKAPIQVELREAIPISRDAKYTIKFRGDDVDEKTSEGLCTYAREVPAGGEASVSFGYDIRYPRRHPPGGLW